MSPHLTAFIELAARGPKSGEVRKGSPHKKSHSHSLEQYAHSIASGNLPLPPDTKTVDFDKLADIEAKFIRARPEARERKSNWIERGNVGTLVKKATGYKCQICEALGFNPVGFLKKKNGEPYIEAHHVIPVSTLQVGSLAATNIMTVCANHHREMHYGDVNVVINPETFEITINENRLKIPKVGIADKPDC